MMRTLAQTGNGWMTFKDAANRTSNQTAERGNVIHLSNLCTEILEVTSDAETAVCNLGSINLAAHLDLAAGTMDWEKLRATVRTAVPFLDRVIDINYYPSAPAAASNPKWRPVGLGVMGLQDVFFALRAAVRLRPGQGAVHPDRRGHLPHRAGGVLRAGRRERAAPGVPGDPRGPRPAPAGPVGRDADPDRALGRAAGGRGRSTACATRC